MAFWIPLAVGLSTAITTALNVYSTYLNYEARQKQISYTANSNAELVKFWDDYYKNTGYRPLYPYKSGAVVNEAYIDSLYAANWQSASAMTGGVFNTSLAVRQVYSQSKHLYRYHYGY